MTKKKDEKKSFRRPETRFLIHAEQWLIGSTRAELHHDERAIWADFLALASLRQGKIEVYSRDQLASQLFASLELVNRSIERFIQTGKIEKKLKKSEKKEIFIIKKWKRYQPEYLWLKPYRLGERQMKQYQEEKKDEVCKHDAERGLYKDKDKGNEKGNEKGGKTNLSSLPFKAQNKIFELQEELKEKREEAQKSDEYFQSRRIDKNKLLESIKRIEIEIEQIINDWSK